MKYISTRGNIKPIPFSDAVMMGLANDGGLLLPEHIPDARSELESWKQLSYKELCVRVMSLFADIEEDTLTSLVDKSYALFREDEVVRIVPVADRHVLELFHGPTLAFKDIALQFLGNIFDQVLADRGGVLNIVAATSGDTGSAAIHGVRNKKNIRIFVMHPHNRVSPVQELQMTSVLDENVHNIAVHGTFDDCQSIMKEVFADLTFKDEYSLGSVNSINWARLLAQVVYYFYAAFRVMGETGSQRVQFSVPTGNFGDIFAGYIAAQMGLPVERLILATNTNDILTRFFTNGDYSCSAVKPTLSPSMDIQVASNFERYLYYRCGQDAGKLSSMMETFKKNRTLSSEHLGSTDELFTAGSCSDDDTLRTMASVWRTHNYLLDPHSAVGWKVADFHASDVPTICLATAHPAKFPDAVIKATGEDAAHHFLIDGLKGSQTRCSQMSPSAIELKELIGRVCAR